MTERRTWGTDVATQRTRGDVTGAISIACRSAGARHRPAPAGGAPWIANDAQ
jgi:hypothetical protein